MKPLLSRNVGARWILRVRTEEPSRGSLGAGAAYTHSLARTHASRPARCQLRDVWLSARRGSRLPAVGGTMACSPSSDSGRRCLGCDLRYVRNSSKSTWDRRHGESHRRHEKLSRATTNQRRRHRGASRGELGSAHCAVAVRVGGEELLDLLRQLPHHFVAVQQNLFRSRCWPAGAAPLDRPTVRIGCRGRRVGLAVFTRDSRPMRACGPQRAARRAGRPGAKGAAFVARQGDTSSHQTSTKSCY